MHRAKGETNGRRGRYPDAGRGKGTCNVEPNAGVERVVCVIVSGRAARLGSPKCHRPAHDASGDAKRGRANRGSPHGDRESGGARRSPSCRCRRNNQRRQGPSCRQESLRRLQEARSRQPAAAKEKESVARSDRGESVLLTERVIARQRLRGRVRAAGHHHYSGTFSPRHNLKICIGPMAIRPRKGACLAEIAQNTTRPAADYLAKKTT